LSRCRYGTRSKAGFILEAQRIHGPEKYLYDKVEYKDCRIHVKIYCCKCKKYFRQKPKDHIAGGGCKKCSTKTRADNKRLSKEQFVTRAVGEHGDFYCYKELKYIDCRTKVKIFCPQCKKHFRVRPDAHLRGTGCKCQIESKGEKKIRKFLEAQDIRFEREKRRELKLNNDLKEKQLKDEDS